MDVVKLFMFRNQKYTLWD